MSTDDHHDLDDLRELAAGRLTPEREEEVRARCDADPELRARLDEYLESFALTRAADVRPPVCRVRFEEVEARLTTHRTRTLLLRAAAALLILTGGVWAAVRLTAERPAPAPTPPPSAITLAAIPLESEILGGEPAIPAFLADYRPVDEGTIRWIDCYVTAEAVARAARRPLLLFVHHETCPMCVEMRSSTFTDAEVRRRLDGFVPVLVNVLSLPPSVRERMKTKRGWPWFGAVDPNGRTLLAFPGVRGPAEFVPRLDESTRMAGTAGPDWTRLNRLVARILAARENEDGGWLGDADDEFRALVGECPDGPLREAAEIGVRRVAQRARAALLGARDLATGGAGIERALEALDLEIEAFEGSPHAEDLRKVRDHLRTHGSFPTVRAAD